MGILTHMLQYSMAVGCVQSQQAPIACAEGAAVEGASAATAEDVLVWVRAHVHVDARARVCTSAYVHQHPRLRPHPYVSGWMHAYVYANACIPTRVLYIVYPTLYLEDYVFHAASCIQYVCIGMAMDIDIGVWV